MTGEPGAIDSHDAEAREAENAQEWFAAILLQPC